MYNVEDLEDKWRVYKSKKRIPWYAFILLEILVVLYVLNKDNVDGKVVNYVKEHNISIPKFIFVKDESTKIPIVDSNNTLSKSDGDKEFKIAIDDPEMVEAVEKEHKRKYLKIEMTDKYPKAEKDEKDCETEVIKSKINIKKKSFIDTKSYKDSLSLAKSYYDKGQYLEAEKWALVTNNINSKLEEGWLIFAKAKVKMGDKDEAIEVLNVYIKKTDSESAKKLLLDIQQGKL